MYAWSCVICGVPAAVPSFKSSKREEIRTPETGVAAEPVEERNGITSDEVHTAKSLHHSMGLRIVFVLAK